MNSQPIVFFGCSMRGGHGVVPQDELRELQTSVETVLGFKLASTHQTQLGIVGKENQLSTIEIHDRDWEYIECADVCVFEISNPSLGVGAEIADSLHMGKSVLCLASTRADLHSISAYIRGKQGSQYVRSTFQFQLYENVEQALEMIRVFVEQEAA